MVLPKVRFIEARRGESIVSVRARKTNPKLQPLTGLLYTVAFAENPDFSAVIKTISAALESSGLEADFMIYDNDARLAVEPEIDPFDLYKGLRTLQELLKPRIPRTATVYVATSMGSRWDIRMSILGGLLPPDEITTVTKAVAAGGGRVAYISKSTQQQAYVFFITVSAQDDEARRGFLTGLQRSCGIFATIQDI